MLYTAILLLITLISLVLQDFMPFLPWAYDARLMIVPVVFFCIAVTVPYPVMLVFAFIVGFVEDARYGVYTGETSDLQFGYGIILYGLMGSFMQGIRPMFRRGRWELPVIMTGFATFFLLLFQWLLINFRRGEFIFPKELWYNIGTSALLSMLISPAVFAGLHWLAKRTQYRISYEGLYSRKSGQTA